MKNLWGVQVGILIWGGGEESSYPLPECRKFSSKAKFKLQEPHQ